VGNTLPSSTIDPGALVAGIVLDLAGDLLVANSASAARNPHPCHITSQCSVALYPPDSNGT
jgi:hypothetical protein